MPQAAIGFDAKRGDSISVQNLSFDGGGADAELPAADWASKVQKTVTDYSSLLRPLSLLALFLMAYLLVIRPVQKHALGRGELGAGLQPALATANAQSLGAGGMDALEHSRHAALLKEQTFELARQNPVDTARAMQAWMREE